ncbi:MAG TPA: ABC transporter ATP-binding protein [Candidatus Brocadiia bacterium]|nr:ABC transporter ATP-binding protein [Candidatus Brocadiales bacterium]
MVDVHLKNVFKQFRTMGTEITVLNNITLDVAGGELFFLLGPSGCGKTTCLRVIAGLTQQDSGNLYFGNRLMNTIPPHKRNTGMVFQNYALWPHMTVYQNVEYGLNVRKLPAHLKEEKVRKALKITRMTEFADKLPNQLSGGEQQRIALARALVIEPDLLLLDEPLSNLDAKLRLELREEIKRIHREVGVTSIYVTHDQKEALSLADRMAVMRDGTIEQIGAPREIYNCPANKFVAGFIGDANFIEGVFYKSKDRGETIMKTAMGDICSSRPNKDFIEGETVMCVVRPEAVKISDVEEHVGAGLKPAPTDRPNQFVAKLINLTYLGDSAELELNVEDKLPLKVKLLGSKWLIPDKPFIISFAKEDVILLKQ